MDRFVIALLVCAGAVSSAPPDSKVTFVQIQPVLDEPVEDAAGELVRRARQDDVTSDPDEALTETPEADTEREGGTSSTAETARPAERGSFPRSTTARSFVRAARPPVRPAAPAPRAVSKLSYFNDASSGATSNLVQPPTKLSGRKFRTTCRCEKIWNCPKLQITVPRCPNEYFLCCS